jgi:glycosyltransferase involved in cell wall biosynthesis
MSCPDGSVVIAVLTYKRPERLKALLPLLIQQAAGSPMPASVLVVDNDPEATASSVVQSLASDTVKYVSEPEPGIAAARSRALLEAQGARVLAFIDDDESPCANWLGSLLETYHRTGAAAVVGPVVSEFEVKPEEWITSGGFFRRRRVPTGTEMTVAYTGNLLLDLEQVARLGVDFHPRFGLTGGEDTLFTRQIVRRGGKIVYCNEAVVTDFVPRDRSTRKWVLQRAFRSGNTWSQVSLELAGGGYGRLEDSCRLLGAGCIRVLGGPLRFTFGVATRSVADKAKGLRTFARGAGMITGALGYSYQEYGRGSG